MPGTIPDVALENQVGLESCVKGDVWGEVEVIDVEELAKKNSPDLARSGLSSNIQFKRQVAMSD
jgi:hypothetical protein